MNVLIVGTGIIGTLYGWVLYQAGFSVSHWVRPGQTENHPAEAVLDLLDERIGYPRFNKVYYPWRCIEAIPVEEQFDLVIVPTNSYQVTEALQTIYPRLPAAVYLICSANWTGDEAFKAIIPANQYVLGYPGAGGALVDGVYLANLCAEIHLPHNDGWNDRVLAMIIPVFATAGIVPDFQTNMLHWLWVHNASTLPVQAAFLEHCEINRFLADSSLLLTAFAAVREGLAICAARGVAVSNYEDVAVFKLPDTLVLMMFKLLYRCYQSTPRYTAHFIQGFLEAQVTYEQIRASAEQLAIPIPALLTLGKVFETNKALPATDL